MAPSPWRLSFPQQLRQRPSSDSSCSAGHTVQLHAPGPLQSMQDGWHAAQVGSGDWGPCSERRESSSDGAPEVWGGWSNTRAVCHLWDGIVTSQTRGVADATGVCEAVITGLTEEGALIWTDGELHNPFNLVLRVYLKCSALICLFNFILLCFILYSASNSVGIRAHCDGLSLPMQVLQVG